MNVHVAPRVRFLDHAKCAAASLASMKGYRHREHEYRRWADEAKAAGRPDDYHIWSDAAKRARSLKWSSFATLVAYHA